MMGTTKEEWDVKNAKEEWDVKNAEEERIEWARMREVERKIKLVRVLDGSDPNSQQIKRTLCLRYTNYDPGCLKP